MPRKADATQKRRKMSLKTLVDISLFSKTKLSTITFNRNIAPSRKIKNESFFLAKTFVDTRFPLWGNPDTYMNELEQLFVSYECSGTPIPEESKTMSLSQTVH